MHTVNRNSVLFFSITLLLIGLNELGYGVVAFPLLVLPACWLIYRALLQEMPTEYKYDRELPTGLGDRLGVYTCLSAMALTLGIKVHTYWTEDASTSSPSWRYISSDFIQRYIRFPENLIFHSKAELQELQIPRLSWTGGTLPAAFAYDCLPTLAYHTFNLRNFIDKKDAGEFLKAYRKTSAALQIQVPPHAGWRQGKVRGPAHPCGG